MRVSCIHCEAPAPDDLALAIEGLGPEERRVLLFIARRLGAERSTSTPALETRDRAAEGEVRS